MTRVFMVAALLFIFSRPLEASNANANINKGDVTVGGVFNLSYNTVSGTQFYVSPRAQYFFSDNFAMGAAASYSISGSNNYGGSGFFSVGPGITYYFWSQARVSAYVGADVLVFGGANANNYMSADANVGLNWFIIPSVAFGPALQITHTFSNPDSSSNNFYYLLGSFSIFL